MSKQNNIIELAQNLTYPELNSVIDSLERRAREIFPKYLEECSKKSKQKHFDRLKKEAKFDKEVLPKINKLISTFSPGQLLKFKGTRDKGYREFMGYTQDRNENITVECRQVRFVNGEKKYGQITTHGINKLTHVYKDDKFVPIKSII